MDRGVRDVPAEAPTAESPPGERPTCTQAAAATGAPDPELVSSEVPAVVLNLSSPSEASSNQGTVFFTADEDLEYRRWNLARRLCLAVRSSDRPDDAAAALALLGRILHNATADPARRKLKSGSPAFEARLGSLGLSDVVAFLEFAGFTAAASKDGGAALVLKIGSVVACSAAAEALCSAERDNAVAAASTPHASTIPPTATPTPISNYAKAPPRPSAPLEQPQSMHRYLIVSCRLTRRSLFRQPRRKLPPPAPAEENAAGGAAADAALAIMAGTPVVLVGLVAKPQLNGVAGLVLLALRHSRCARHRPRCDRA